MIQPPTAEQLPFCPPDPDAETETETDAEKTDSKKNKERMGCCFCLFILGFFVTSIVGLAVDWNHAGTCDHPVAAQQLNLWRLILICFMCVH